MREISIIGLGYIGLPTAAMFAANGVKVRGVEIKEEICRSINSGNIHIHEPHLKELVQQAVLKGMITCSTRLESVEAYIIAVPTPITENQKADLSYICAAAEQISAVIKKGDLVIIESTVSPGCSVNLVKPILESGGLKAGVDFYLAHCPERVMLGRVIYELAHNSRIIGGINHESAEKARELYAAFVKGEMYLTDINTAELCKLVENTYRDVNIALANELAKICERLDCNVWEVIEFANKHPRVHMHHPGPGVGGHCLAVDPWFIVQAAPEEAKLISLARQINDGMPEYIYQRIRKILDPGSRIFILGCTYKADVDDVRESPISLLSKCLKQDYQVEIYDPYIAEYSGNIYEMCRGMDMMIIGVNHHQFKNIDWELVAKNVRQKKIMDTRNFLNVRQLQHLGFEIYSVGKSEQYDSDEVFKHNAQE